ncbi:MAG: Anhydro-N-acetylmuramic acid kinase [candidate division WS2 bacterium]|nr:Anhydro-N-acetylmuramic acid kinase [Candidatus Lithacetigena glycinireducens]MBT9174481.1 Anhydro-N-acetylmuramic acid kinase [Candidatus Lithacetigena glycinireducens]
MESRVPDIILENIRNKYKRLICGVNSGTSADSTDIVLVKANNFGENLSFEFVSFRSFPHPQPLRRQILSLLYPAKRSIRAVVLASYNITEFTFKSLSSFLKTLNMNFKDIDLIGFHGQTVYHQANQRLTFQLGEGDILAQKTGITVVWGFRQRDIGAGGMGAPLIPYLDLLLFKNYPGLVIQNIGGISNLTYIPTSGRKEDVLAFDNGPGNTLIDLAIERLFGVIEGDRNGRYSKKGVVSRALLEYMLEHPYLDKKPPKTTGREEFGKVFLEKIIKKSLNLQLSSYDLIRTLVEFTTCSIADSYRRFLPEVTMIAGSGGGFYNQTLVSSLKEKIHPLKLITTDELGVPAKARESLLFAVLANDLIAGIPTSIPQATGAKMPVPLGRISLGF